MADRVLRYEFPPSDNGMQTYADLVLTNGHVIRVWSDGNVEQVS